MVQKKLVCNIADKKKLVDKLIEKLDSFKFYNQIPKENNIPLINDEYETILFFETTHKEYKIVRINYQNMIKCEIKNFLYNNENFLFSKSKFYDQFYINNDFSGKILCLLEIALKKDKDNFFKLLSLGPPNEFRWFSWLSIAIFHNEFKVFGYSEYNELLKKELNQNISEQIEKDLNRSAPTIPYFHIPENLSLIYNILKAYALYDEEINYCQGINNLVANLLLVSDGNEITTFNILLYLFNINASINLRGFYIQGFPKLEMYVFLLREIIKEELPLLHNKILELNIPDELWLYKWIQSLYIIVLPFNAVVRLFDCIFSYGLEFILNFSIVFISHFKEAILKSQDLGDFLDCFKVNFKDDFELITFRETMIVNSKKLVLSESLIFRLKKKYESLENEKKSINQKEESKSYGNSITRCDIRIKYGKLNQKNEIIKFHDNMMQITKINSKYKMTEIKINKIEFEWEDKEFKNNIKENNTRKNNSSNFYINKTEVARSNSA